MPILRIVSNKKLSDDEVNQVKILGSILGYKDPRHIWVEVSDALTQSDVMVVTVTVNKTDWMNSAFKEFCREIAKYLRETTNKSVEVVNPSEFGIHSICWYPTKEGANTYGGGS